MTTLPDDYARCHGAYDSSRLLFHWQCRECLRCTAPMRDNVLYSYMTPPEFTTTCPDRLAP
jgi:hypothetical protein